MNPTAPVPESILPTGHSCYWSAHTCSALGCQVLGVAVAWQLYALTGSAFDLGLGVGSQFAIRHSLFAPSPAND